MRDGLTRERESSAGTASEPAFLDSYSAKLVLISSANAGAEFPIDRERLILGRGPGVDIAFDDPDMSRQHARIDCEEGAPGIRDLGSTNGTFVNGAAVQAAELKNGDRIQLGDRTFQFVVEERHPAPEVYELDIED
jgi:pSer/pThr/pTyr-binding forkhead associated (FHA) protein